MGVGLLRLPMELVVTLEKYWDASNKKTCVMKKTCEKKTQQNTWVVSLQKGAVPSSVGGFSRVIFKETGHMALSEALKFILVQPWIQHDPTNGQETENSQECQNRSKDLPMENPIQMPHKNWNICLYIYIYYMYIYV